jgi:hypothetical protein
MNDTYAFNSIGDFCLFLKRNENNPNILYFLPIKEAYENSFGGCACNKKLRIEDAKKVYQQKITNALIGDINILKNILNSNKLIFKNNNEIFIEL